VIGDRLGRMPTELRLWAAAALCLLPLGLTWSTEAGTSTFGLTRAGTCSYAGPAAFCTIGPYVPGSHVTGAGSPARVFLVFAAAVLVWAATRPRTPRTRRWARLAVVGVAVALLLALSQRAVTASLCLASALLLAAPPAWRSRPGEAVFGNAPSRR